MEDGRYNTMTDWDELKANIEARQQKMSYKYFWKYVYDARWWVNHTKYDLSKRIQRFKRGYSYSDVWNMYPDMFVTMGRAMLYLSEHHVAYPGNDEYPTSEAWEADLKKYGTILARMNDIDYDDYSEQNYEEAQEAVHWMADHLGSLWD